MLDNFREIVIDVLKIVRRYIFSVVTLVLSAVVIALVLFGEKQDAFFIGAVLFTSVTMGLVQEIHAYISLRKLRALAAPRAQVVRGDHTEIIDTKRVREGDVVVLEPGGELVADGVLVEAVGLELNESFLTGESAPQPKHTKSQVWAGSFVSAGTGRVRVTAVGRRTRIGQMAGEVRQYRPRTSPSERSIGIIITILSWVLLASVLGLAGVQEDNLRVDFIRQVAAVTATILPEGLILAASLLFARSAIKLMRVQVLTQRVQSVELLARMQTLCLDKTGTLTESTMSVREFRAYGNHDRLKLARQLQAYAMISGAKDEFSQAILEAVPMKNIVDGAVVEAFSSERKYGVVQLVDSRLAVGAASAIANLITAKSATTWLAAVADQSQKSGERVLAAATSKRGVWSLIGVVLLEQPIKPSAERTLNFFRRRGVSIKIISGDQAATVEYVARTLNVLSDGQLAVRGEELEGLSSHELASKARQTPVFAEVSPQQKASLVRALRREGAVAMVGDGANDALALKQADLGISMFAAADITRRVADIILIKNDFTDLPLGVRLADRVITALELITLAFLAKVAFGLGLIIASLLWQAPYPLSPRTITLLNYSIIGAPLVVWLVYSLTRVRATDEGSFLRKLTPIFAGNGLLACVATIIFMGGLRFLGIGATNWPVYCFGLGLGLGVVLWAPVAIRVKDIVLSRELALRCTGFSLLLTAAIACIPSAASFFGLSGAQWFVGLAAFIAAGVVVCMQYWFASRLGRLQRSR